jgi:hypothetical protein
MSFNWKSFLQQWNDEILEILKKATWQFSPMELSALREGRMGYPGASEQEIKDLETRLNVTLPPSYKEFLKFTNGWKQIGFDAESTKLFSTTEIDWFNVKNPEAIDSWMVGAQFMPEVPDEVYFIYGSEQDPVHMRNSYLKSALAISQLVDAGVYLLNPEVVTEDGEWEAWFFGFRLPGANRYRSFEAMMKAEYVRISQSLSLL